MTATETEAYRQEENERAQPNGSFPERRDDSLRMCSLQRTCHGKPQGIILAQDNAAVQSQARSCGATGISGHRASTGYFSLLMRLFRRCRKRVGGIEFA